MGYAINLKTVEANILDRTENADRFFKEIRKIPQLTQEEEQELFEVYHNGTPSEKEKAKEKIILANQRFVVSVAKKYSTQDNLLDHINECNIALINSIDKFDPSLGNKFVTFAVWQMRRKMNEYRTQVEEMVKKTNNTKTFHVISSAINDFTQENEREPTSEELLEIVNKKYGKKIKDTADLLELRMTRVDQFGDDEEDLSSLCDISDYNRASASVNAYNASVDREYMARLVESLLSSFSERDQMLIKMKFGLVERNGIKREFSVSEISDELGITKERVRQLEKELLVKLRKRYKTNIQKILGLS